MPLGPVTVLDSENLSAAERTLLSNAATGTLTDLRAGSAELDDPAQGVTWGAGRQIRAELLIELLRGTQRHDNGPARAVKLQGARITGSLDLEAAAITCPLLLRQCYITEPVSFDEATGSAIRLPGCYMPAFTARQLRITGDLSLDDVIADEVDLRGAHIGGQLNLDGTSLTNPGSTALSTENLTADQGMSCYGFTASGEVCLRGARIGSELNLGGATLTNPGATAMSAQGLTVGQDMSCGYGFTAMGEINLNGASIGGQLNLVGASLSNPDQTALTAEGLTVNQDMSCRSLTASGKIYLLGARIGRHLNLKAATLTNPGGKALSVENAAIGHDMTCCDGFTANGRIDLRGTRIGALLNLDSARLSNPGDIALVASNATIGHSMSCGNGFTATGEINLDSAHIHGELTLAQASLTNPDRPTPALWAEGLTVDHGMHCHGLNMSGEIRLAGASIGGDLDLTGASLVGPAGAALSLEAADIKTLRLPEKPPDGGIDLTNAKVGVFDDNQEGWPSTLWLWGFVYDTFTNEAISTCARLQWLKRNPGRFSPQLYDQLAATYRRAGDDTAARKVAIAKQWHRRRALNPLNWLWYATVGYGYRPWLAAIWLAGFVGLGTWVFSGAYPAHMIALSTHPPAFHAAAYALDLLLPVIGLGQKSAWQPQGSAYQYWSWVLTGAGWVLTTAVVAGLTGILKRS